MSPSPSGGALAPFRLRSFRFQWPADLATSWSFEMEALILGWYVLVETESVLALTVFGSLQYFGTLVAPLYGVIGDRIGHRNLLCLMRAAYAALAGTLMILAATGALSVVPVFVIAVLAGIVRPSDILLRNAVIGETIPPEQLMRAMSISRTTTDSARIIGALAGAGLVASLGIGWAYLAVTGFYVLAVALTLGIAGAPPKPAMPLTRVSPWRDLGDGLAYVWNTPHLLAAMALALLVNLTAFPLSNGLLPYVAREVYHIDQTGLSYLVASFALGALVGSIALTTHGGAIRPARIMLVFGLAWYTALLLFAQAETLISGIALMILAGFLQSLCMLPMSVMLLRVTDAPFRGRVMGVRMLAVYGLPLGLLAAGPVIGLLGFAGAATAYCLIGLLFTALIALRWRAHLWRLDAPANLR
jgi:predicted MFS family arabinose efflux permease